MGKSNNEKKAAAAAAGKAPKKTKQQENAGKSASQKKAEQKAKKAAKGEKAGNYGKAAGKVCALFQVKSGPIFLISPRSRLRGDDIDKVTKNVGHPDGCVPPPRTSRSLAANWNLDILGQE